MPIATFAAMVARKRRRERRAQSEARSALLEEDGFPGREPLEARFRRANARFVIQLRWYERHARQSRIQYQALQAATVILGGATPVLVLVGGVPKWLQAVPGALGAIAAGIVGFTQWRENWLRYQSTAEALKHENALFRTRTGQWYSARRDDEAVLDSYVRAIEEITMAEVAVWRSGGEESESARDGDAAADGGSGG
jgi:Protein of unknown function (DUF4231)